MLVKEHSENKFYNKGDKVFINNKIYEALSDIEENTEFSTDNFEENDSYRTYTIDLKIIKKV